MARDIDGDLRMAIRAAADRGGFVILQGDQSTGKTRTLLQAVRDTLSKEVPGWDVVQPLDVTALMTLAAAPAGQVIIWLDQLERYLDQTGGLPARVVHELLNAGMLILGTLCDYNARSTPQTDGPSDPYGNDHHVLCLADVFDLPDDLTDTERQRAQAFTADERIRIALRTTDMGFAQVLTAGPQLIRRWEQPSTDDRCGAAVITAALDAFRVGARGPVSMQYLQAAAPAYLTDMQRARIDQGRWFTHALGYATTKVGNGIGALNPVATVTGRTVGYLPADYLRQYALSRRRAEPVANEVWKQLVRDHRQQDTFRLAEGAQRRGRLQDAEGLFRRLADTGDRTAAERLIDILERQNRAGEAIEVCRAHAHDASSTIRLADLLARHDETGAAIEELRPYAGHVAASVRLATLFVADGSCDEAVGVLWPHAADRVAGAQLLALLAEQQRRHDARAALQPHAVDGPTAVSMANLLVDRGWIDEALEILVAHLDDVDGSAAIRTAELLVSVGREADAEELLRRHAAVGNTYAAAYLADLMINQGRHEDAKAILMPFAAEDGYAAEQLAEVHLALGDGDLAVTVLQQRADSDEYVAVRLADLLAQHKQIDEACALLRPHLPESDGHAVRKLADLLAGCGKPEEAIDLLRQHPENMNCTDQLADLLAELGRIDEAVAELAAHAESGDQHAATRQAQLLLKQDRFDEAVLALRRHSRSRDGYAAAHLSRLFLSQRRIDDAITTLRQRTDDGDEPAAIQLITLLTKEKRIDDLKQEIAAGTPGAYESLRVIQNPVRRF